MTETQYKWLDFFHRYYENDLKRISAAEGFAAPGARGEVVHDIYVEFMDYVRWNANAADELINEPDRCLNEMRELLKQHLMYNGIPTEVAVRVKRIPQRVKIRQLRERHVNRLVTIEGTVRRATKVQPRCIEATFECARCKNVVTVLQNEAGSQAPFIEPYYCDSDRCCDETRKAVFTFLYSNSVFVDNQKIRIQESADDLRAGEQPQDITVMCTSNLAGTCYPGDRVVLTGILRAYQEVKNGKKSADFYVELDALTVEMEQSSYEELNITEKDVADIMALSKDPNLRRKLLASVAPSIYGYPEVKEAILNQLFSGVPKQLPDGTRIRGDIHVLLMGDPGIAKSQLLRMARKISPRGVFVSGKNASTAGLTAAAVKDELDGQWNVEGGAMVMADGGICCIDEMDKMGKDDRSSIHEAMEQQIINVAKAGILASLKCRCSVLGAANPKLGRFDEYESIPSQINMPPSLLSRFDLMFFLKDTVSEQRDTEIASHILKTHRAGQILAQISARKGTFKREDAERETAAVKPEVDPELLRKYIAYARTNVFPVMPEEAYDLLIKFYNQIRRKGKEDNAVAMTARQLEGMVRIAESNARMRLSDTVSIADVQQTINIIMASLQQVSVDKDTGRIDIDSITVGVTQSQRDRIKSLKNVIFELSKLSPDKAVAYDKVLEMAVEGGWDKEKATKELDKLFEIGEVFRPRAGYVALS